MVVKPMDLQQLAKLIANGSVKTLTITCSRCTRQGNFVAETRKEATARAIAKGWRGRKDDKGVLKEICPRCY